MKRRQRILFVDDESNFLEGLRRMLRKRRKQWDMSFVESVDEALHAIKKREFDAIVSDIQMPVKTGFDLLKTLRANEDTRTMPVVILTGNAEIALKRRALNLGATDLLNKPVNREDLIARLVSVLRLKSYQDELKDQNELLELKVRERTAELSFLHKDIIWRLAKAGELRDEETGNHIVRVAKYSFILARNLGLASNEVEAILLTSPLHDLGKIGIPDSILLKTGKLNSDEWVIMKQHTEIGASILMEKPKGMEIFMDLLGSRESERFVNAIDPTRETAATIALTHHEKWDGTGYPRGLKGEDIPIAGRIVAMADVYDALRSERPYKRAFSPEKAFAIIREEAGSHFDPDVFDAFVLSQSEFEAVKARYFD